MAPSKDFYAILGVNSTADDAEIKKVYRRLAKQYHPDANANDPVAAEKFKEISEAYNVLGNTEKRKQYDEMRRYGAFDGGGARGGRGGGFGGFQQGRPGYTDFQNVDIGGGFGGGFGDIFSSIFGQAANKSGGRGRVPEQGQSVESTVDVDFRTAVKGGKVAVNLEVTEECGTCGGSGGAPGSTMRVCGECHGRGTVSYSQGGFAVNRTCPNCLGRGQVPSKPCPTCAGRGEVRSVKKVNITVPEGTDTGAKVRLRGQGGKGTNGGQPGDLIITFNVLPDRFYKRDGLDLIASVPLNIAQATLGSKISVRTMDDKKVAIKIPPGTPSGKTFKVKGQGVKKGDRRGDLLIEIMIEVPENLTEEQEQMMKDFAEAGGLKY